MDIAAFRGLRYSPSLSGGQDAATAPPYDVISPEEHQALLDRSEANVTRLTLGLRPGETGAYNERAALLDRWLREGVLAPEDESVLYAYEVEYVVPGTEERAHFLGLTALGRLYPFDEGTVFPHEETFPKVVDDRRRLLEATRTHLESIFLLYSDEAGDIDALLETAVEGEPVVRVEARPGEFHSLHVLRGDVVAKLVAAFAPLKTIIADGHHRYTMGLRHAADHPADAAAAWQLMTFGNLRGKGLSILATHRLVKLAEGRLPEALDLLRERLEVVDAGSEDLTIETAAGERLPCRFPASERSSRRGVSATNYGLLHEQILEEWLAPLVARDAEGAPRVHYYKEGTGEDRALREGEGDLLFRMRPVDSAEFRDVVEAGGLYPHKTTYFYPKLWSGLVLWRLDDQ